MLEYAKSDIHRRAWHSENEQPWTIVVNLSKTSWFKNIQTKNKRTKEARSNQLFALGEHGCFQWYIIQYRYIRAHHPFVWLRSWHWPDAQESCDFAYQNMLF